MGTTKGAGNQADSTNNWRGGAIAKKRLQLAGLRVFVILAISYHFIAGIGSDGEMSNNPGKKGKPAPWVRREREDRERALQEYRLLHHAAYRAWHAARNEVARQARSEADHLFPGLSGITKSMKHSDKIVKAWDKANPNPMTWDEYKALEEEFSKTYEPIDRS